MEWIDFDSRDCVSGTIIKNRFGEVGSVKYIFDKLISISIEEYTYSIYKDGSYRLNVVSDHDITHMKKEGEMKDTTKLVDFDLERFKSGEPAFLGEFDTEYAYIGIDPFVNNKSIIVAAWRNNTGGGCDHIYMSGATQGKGILKMRPKTVTRYLNVPKDKRLSAIQFETEDAAREYATQENAGCFGAIAVPVDVEL